MPSGRGSGVASWPLALPQKLANVRPEPPVDTLLRSQNDVGPDKVRRRFTAASRFIVGSIFLTGQQRLEFDSFFQDELEAGALAFDWPGIDPITDADRSVRIQVAGEEFISGAPAKPDRTIRLDLRVEILP